MIMGENIHFSYIVLLALISVNADDCLQEVPLWGKALYENIKDNSREYVSGETSQQRKKMD